MTNNFDLRKFLTENKLTSVAKTVNEAPNMPPVPGQKPKMPPVPGQAKPGNSSTTMTPENLAKFKEALKLLAQIAGKQGGIPDGLATPLMKIMQTIHLDNSNQKTNEETTLNEYEHHYEIRNGECRKYNDEGDYTVVSMHYCQYNEGNINESDGYVEVMGDDFDEAVDQIVFAWEQWKNGPMTEPEDIEPAREDVVSYIKSLLK